ncbi:hypothetical protein JB92DRAFT_3024529 [Gautieria morchelliformis]|nr:hypothetical protein JB92DRAFT_3024529 [Gautieria morchelliformis]
MLSAIAARKAAQAAKQEQFRPHNDANDASEMAQAPVLSGSGSATPQKRKAKGGDVPRKISLKRAKKLTTADIGRTRYFDVEQPIEYFNDDDLRPNSRGSPSPSIQNSTPEHGLASGFVTEDHGTNRGYSPSRPVFDSSDEDEEELGHESHPNPPGNTLETSSSTSLKVSRQLFVPRLDLNCFRITSGEIEILDISLDVDDLTGTLILFPPGHSLTFVGAAYITLLQGSIEMLGTPLQPSLQSHRVFSPRCSPLVTLETPDISNVERHSDGSDGSKETLLPHRIRNAVSASDSVVVINPLISGVEGLGKVCRIFDGVFDVGFDVREKDAEDAIGVEGFHPISPHFRNHPQLQPFLMPESWDESLDSAVPSLSSSDEVTPLASSRSFVALIRGPKKCGKSTFARTLLNRLTTRYRRVAFLECDLGQSEFTPGGMVALNIVSKPVFGPPFTHPIMPYRAHYVGHSTPRSSPSHYLACIQALIQTYRMDVKYAYQADDISDEEGLQETSPKMTDNRLESFVPLVVNTQGWLKGLGGDLLRKIEEIVDASDIFDLDTKPATFPQRNQHTHPCNTRLHAVQPILSSPLAAYYTPADHRSLSILSYFHSHFSTRGREVRSWSTELPLCAHQPWEVDCKEAIQRFVLVGAGLEDVIPEELAHAINCGLVALVCDEDTTLDSSVTENDSCLYTQGAPVSSPNTSRCLGLALVRGVDATMDILHLLTPVSPTLFHKCHVLVMGELELPAWGMLDFRQGQNEGVAGIKWGKVPYLQMGGRESAAIGGTRRRVRKNLMRRSQI